MYVVAVIYMTLIMFSDIMIVSAPEIQTLTIIAVFKPSMTQASNCAVSTSTVVAFAGVSILENRSGAIYGVGATDDAEP